MPFQTILTKECSLQGFFFKFSNCPTPELTVLYDFYYHYSKIEKIMNVFDIKKNNILYKIQTSGIKYSI